MTGTFGGLHFPKGGNFIGRTLLFTDVKMFPKGEEVSGHMWAQSVDYMQYEKFKKGDSLKIVGTVIKYFKYNGEKPKKDFSIKITSCEKYDNSEGLLPMNHNHNNEGI